MFSRPSAFADGARGTGAHCDYPRPLSQAHAPRAPGARLTALLVVMVLVSALAVVYVRHRNRMLFVQLQTLQAERDKLNIEWGKLLLEQGAWSEHRRIEERARRQLGLTIPRPEQTVVVHSTERAKP